MSEITRNMARKEIHEKSCMYCKHFDQLDGEAYCSDMSYDYPTWFECYKRPHMANLKHFPFVTEQKCFEVKELKDA